MKKRNADARNLGALLRGELAAVETYKRALDSVAGLDGVGPELRRIEAEHKDALCLLQEHIADVPPDPALWSEWAEAVEAAARAFGDKAAIKALKAGEKDGVQSYERALRDRTLNTEIRRIISSRLLPKTKARIPALDRLLAKV